MKYAITGHTAGIGKAFSELPEVKNNFVGFSRTTGYNIKSADDRRRIVKDSEECDVFINNAYNLYHQTDMLYELHRKWKNKPKVIVNLGSNTTESMKDFPHPYTAHKASLEAASLQLSGIKCQCSTVLIKFGYVGSEKILKFLQPQYYIHCEEAAQIILQVADLAAKYNVKTMTILPKEYD